MDAEKVRRITDPNDLSALMANAKRLGREDVYWAAFKQRCSLEGTDMSDPLERAFADVLNAYEQLLTEKNDRTTRATRTRQKMKNKGVHQCLLDWAMGSATEGFKLLIENGLPELTAEYVVIRHKDHFPSEVVEAARQRLLAVGVEVD